MTELAAGFRKKWGFRVLKLKAGVLSPAEELRTLGADEAYRRLLQTGARPHNEICYHAIRTGDDPGQHTIVFGMEGETVELTVRASNRDCYASGALMAAKFVVKQQPGIYDMFAVLGLS